MFQEAFQATFLGKNSLPRIALSFLNIEINLYFSAVHSSLFLGYILIFLAKIPHPKVLNVCTPPCRGKYSCLHVMALKYQIE